ncbi:hypothetical protein OF83DRAFT_1161189 [Amylostereum chailletii]|nr:hypothetical protein OF83DRAFT_1161189 [Amylostereum chailletii]
MDPFHFDAYPSSYSDSSSAPRTPSPRTSDGIPSLPHSPAHFKLEIEPVKNIFADPMGDEQGIAPEGFHPWQNIQPMPVQYHTPPGSLLGELYEHDLPQEHPIQDTFPDHRHIVPSNDWQQHHSRPSSAVSQDFGAVRRATYPYVRQDRDELSHYSLPSFGHHHDDQNIPHSFSSRQDIMYGEPLPLLDHSPQVISLGPDHGYPSSYDLSSSPAHSYHELDHHVKLEESAPVIVPSQIIYRSPSLDHMHPMSYLPHHAGLPVQHTDDAASKETQYLRRRCFNCSQTEPPSWRRSTLNPGKIVCNKCGLYERTHLRPRPLLSVASSGSAPASSYNSPSPASFSLPLERSSHSPTLLPRDGGIRLPNVDIASLSVQDSPRREYPHPHSQGDYFSGAPAPSSSIDIPRAGSADMPEVTGWQSVPMDMPSPGRRKQSILRKTVVA